MSTFLKKGDVVLYRGRIADVIGVRHGWRRIRIRNTTNDEIELNEISLGGDLDCCWFAGREYHTTLPGVTVKIEHVNPELSRIRGLRSDAAGIWIWNATSGRMVGKEDDPTVPHLKPYFAHESPPTERIAPQETVKADDKIEWERLIEGPLFVCQRTSREQTHPDRTPAMLSGSIGSELTRLGRFMTSEEACAVASDGDLEQIAFWTGEWLRTAQAELAKRKAAKDVNDGT